MRVGVVGNGNIVRRFLKDAAGLEKVSLKAICVREKSLEKGQNLADIYGMDVYTDYGEFLRDSEVDTVYIGLINTQHYPYARGALLAGKHVICEKPLTVTAVQAEELAGLARERGLFFWEAFKLPYGPLLPAVKEALPLLGPIRAVQCSYCRTGKAYEEYLAGNVRPVLDPDCAGGSLHDVNIYNLHFVVSLFGEPLGLSYTANRGFNGADTSGTAVLRYDGCFAVCTAAMDCSSDNFCMVQGERGWIRTDGPISSASRAVIRLAGEEERILAENPEGGSLRPEIQAFAEQLEAGDTAPCYGMLEHSLRVMRVLEALSV